MKIKKFFVKIFIIFFIFNNYSVSSNEINFLSSDINVQDNGNIILANDSETTIPKKILI